jgi:hypothetical protein
VFHFLQKEAEEKLKEYGYEPNDYEVKIIPVYYPDNLGRYMGDDKFVLLPKFVEDKELANETTDITVSEQCASITCLNKVGESLYYSIHEYTEDEYDIPMKPDIFFLGKTAKMPVQSLIELKVQLNLPIQEMNVLLSKVVNLDLDEKVEILKKCQFEQKEIDKVLGIGIYAGINQKREKILELLQSDDVSPEMVNELFQQIF